MANDSGSYDDCDESSPALSKLVVDGDEKKKMKKLNAEKSKEGTTGLAAWTNGWTADGLPLVHRNVVGEPMGRSQWDSSLLACLGRNDEFCSSDIEVCLLGSLVPCVLYGSNVERLGSAPGTFPDHCVTYSFLHLFGNSCCGWNIFTPWFSYATRAAVRRKFNLEGTCEALHRSCGCCGSCVEDEVQRERCESACDCATHLFCHACALCQEGRELRRKLPHPRFNAQPVLVMIPPGEQTMGRGA